MTILRIEHQVRDFDAWQRAFDSDPIGRRRGGVLSYRVARATDDPDHVMIDLEFGTAGEAEAFLTELRTLWGRVDVIRNPRARIAEVVASRELGDADRAD